MVSEITNTPKALRLHIGVFGPTNAGKSTLINAISGQDVALTSPIAGTTTDPVFKPMELLPLGPVVFIDTAGLDDNTELGALRMKKSYSQLEACDAVIFVVSSVEKDIDKIKDNLIRIKKNNVPIIIVVNKIENVSPDFDIRDFSNVYVEINLSDKKEIIKVKQALIDTLQDKTEEHSITKDLVKKGDIVLLIVPQDIQAPKGRLILPEVQTIRDLLDNGCIPMSVTADNITYALSALSVKPSLVITDSQLYKKVSEVIPQDIRLTSFSMLMAKNKADINRLVEGAKAIDTLEDNDKVLILESCSHHPMDGDIARQQIPALLRKYTGKNLDIVNCSGQIVTEDISQYKLAIHCGGCMVNRKAMLAKQQKFVDLNVPMTNFGVAIAYMNGILKRVCY